MMAALGGKALPPSTIGKLVLAAVNAKIDRRRKRSLRATPPGWELARVMKGVPSGCLRSAASSPGSARQNSARADWGNGNGVHADFMAELKQKSKERKKGNKSPIPLSSFPNRTMLLGFFAQFTWDNWGKRDGQVEEGMVKISAKRRLTTNPLGDRDMNPDRANLSVGGPAKPLPDVRRAGGPGSEEAGKPRNLSRGGV